jgi:2-polyprenyl-3-methyl-5-hydroxy-6-metoxy-1,4-benzoquinol methylase
MSLSGSRQSAASPPETQKATRRQLLCPLCGSRDTGVSKTIEVEPVIKLWREIYQIEIRAEFHDIAQMELRSCANCAVSFFAPECLAGSALMYAQLADRGTYYLSAKWEYEVALKDLQGREKILEIGCGSGIFIALAKQVASLSVEGLEQNRGAVTEALQRGMRVREATAEDVAKQSPATYDAVCSFQVLEHVPRPAEFLQACCALLRPGGLLILAVPNQRSYVRHMVNPLDMPPHHMTRWTRKALERVQAHFPLRVQHINYEPLTDYQIEWYVDTYGSALRRRGLGLLAHPWIRTQIVRLIRRLGIGGFLRGQNIYACYVRS